MESLIGTIVVLLQLALSGFLMWGGWLVLKDGLGGRRTDAADAAQMPAAASKAQADDFERVASLVLLALLCTTLAAPA
jgi:hypothetical protein